MRAVALALAGTLGVGNLVGVAAALLEGGAGVLFWMWLSCFASMVMKFTEIKLGMAYRQVTKQGNFQGGAMFYMSKKAGRIFALLCLLCSLTVGCAMQSSAFAGAILGKTACGFPGLLAGALLLLPLAAALYKGKSRLFDLTALIVPLMSALYIFLCMILLIHHRTALPQALFSVFKNAFYPKSALLGGGVSIFTVLRLGIVRGILSNEAGCGTAPMAHGTSGAESSDGQGALGMVEVAFDTLLLCSLTGLCLLVCPSSLEETSGISALIHAFSSVFGGLAKPLLSLSIYFFAIATLLCWAFYGRQCLSFLFPKKKSDRIFDLLFCLTAFLAPLLAEDAILSFADPIITLMTILNLYFLFKHRKDLRSSKPHKTKD